MTSRFTIAHYILSIKYTDFKYNTWRYQEEYVNLRNTVSDCLYKSNLNEGNITNDSIQEFIKLLSSFGIDKDSLKLLSKDIHSLITHSI